MGVKTVTPEVNGYCGRLRELVIKGAGRCVGWGVGGAWFSWCHYLSHLVFPIGEAVYKQMQNSEMLTLFPNIINHVGRNLNFKTSAVAKLILTRDIRGGGNCRVVSSKGF